MESNDLLCKADWYCLCTQWGNPGGYIRWLRDYQPSSLPKELAALVNVPQDPIWHPEGDAFEHTCQVTDRMADIMSREGIMGDRRVVFMLAAICHDMGKAVSTLMHPDKGRWVSPGHEVSGVPIAAAFLKSIGTFPANILQILPLVRWHMAHTRKEFTSKAIRKLARELQPMTIRDLFYVMEADCRGRGSASSGVPELVRNALLLQADVMGLYDGPHPRDKRSAEDLVGVWSS